MENKEIKKIEMLEYKGFKGIKENMKNISCPPKACAVGSTPTRCTTYNRQRDFDG